MAGTATGPEFDPRYDPRFQRGWTPSETDARAGCCRKNEWRGDDRGGTGILPVGGPVTGGTPVPRRTAAQ